MLARQTETIERFGEERYKFTEIDVLGAEIYDLLRNGRPADSSRLHTPTVRSIRILV
jgi:hypothetical protein